MRGSSEIFQAIEGMDEDGKAKASCCLMVEKRFGDMRRKPEVQRLAYMQNANVRIRLTNDHVMVDLGFEDCTDYDYLQALELCREFTVMKEACESGGNPASDLSLILSITPKGEYDFFLRGTDAAWSILPEQSVEMCSAIRLMFVKEKFGAYRQKMH